MHSCSGEALGSPPLRDQQLQLCTRLGAREHHLEQLKGTRQNTATMQIRICLLSLAGAFEPGKEKLPMGVMHSPKRIWSLNF